MKLSSEKNALYETLRADIAAEGARVLLLSPPSDWPQQYSIIRENEGVRVLVYIWTLTFDTARGDYKFQLTSVDGNQFLFNPDVRTIVLGYLPSRRLYLASDSNYRTEPFGSSPGIQTTDEHLRDAELTGLKAFEKRGTGEIAIVVRHDMLATYLLEAEEIHEIGRRTDGARDVNNIVIDAHAPPTEIPLVPRSRETVRVERAIRSASFARRVMSAYGRCCCVCLLQLDLVEAAHIVPAGAPLSSDDTRNGLCLCALHHTAYDGGLLGIHPDYSVSVSEKRVESLRIVQRQGGIEHFRAALRDYLTLPGDATNYPDQDLLRQGLIVREWSS